jgi:hypothetical protein
VRSRSLGELAYAELSGDRERLALLLYSRSAGGFMKESLPWMPI